jgi:hypothetical protein
MVQLEQLFGAATVLGSIDDTSTEANKLWSAQKLDGLFDGLPSIYAQLNSSVSFTALALGGADLQGLLDGKSNITHNHDDRYSQLGHTHQIADITGLQTALSGKVDVTKLGAPNGVATLDATGFVAASQLPSFVDDVLEYANLAAFPATGEAGKIYVPVDTNKPYRWSGSTYIEISASPGSTDAVAEGSVNLYFTNARAVAALSGTLTSYAKLNGATFTGKVKTPAPAAGGAGINIGAGVAPTAPTAGDLYIAGDSMFFRGSTATQTIGTLAANQVWAGTNYYNGQLIANTLVNFTNAGTTTLGAYGALMIGASTTVNLAFDRTSIQARNNGAAADLKLQPLGGNVLVGGVAVSLSTHNHDGTYQPKSTVLDGLAGLTLAGNQNLVVKVNAAGDGFVLATDATGGGGTGTGLTDTDYGDVAVSNGGTVMTVQAATGAFAVGGNATVAGSLTVNGTNVLTALSGKLTAIDNSAAWGAGAVRLAAPVLTIGDPATVATTTISEGSSNALGYIELDLPGGAGGVFFGSNIGTRTQFLTYGSVTGVEFTHDPYVNNNVMWHAGNFVPGSKINTTEKGAANGVATLDSSGKVPSAQLPSFVDDVLEYASQAALPATGESGKIYVTTDTNPAAQWRWSGSGYQQITSSPGSTDAVPEGSVNLYFTDTRVRGTALTGYVIAGAATAVTATDTIVAAFGKVEKQIAENSGAIDAANTAIAEKLDQTGGVLTGSLTMDAALLMRGSPYIIGKSIDGTVEYGRIFFSAAAAVLRGNSHTFAKLDGTVVAQLDNSGNLDVTGAITQNGKALQEQITVGTVAPSNPVQGQLWVDTN